MRGFDQAGFVGGAREPLAGAVQTEIDAKLRREQIRCHHQRVNRFENLFLVGGALDKRFALLVEGAGERMGQIALRQREADCVADPCLSGVILDVETRFHLDTAPQIVFEPQFVLGLALTRIGQERQSQ